MVVDGGDVAEPRRRERAVTPLYILEREKRKNGKMKTESDREGEQMRWKRKIPQKFT